MTLNHRKTVTYRLNQAARVFRVRTGGALAVIGLHSGQESVLKALAETDGQSMSELAATLTVQPPTVTKMVSRLAAQGYLQRRTAVGGDGRQAHVFLTEQGREAIADIDKVLKRIEKQALAGIEDRDRKRLRRLLRQVERNLGAKADAEADAEPEAEEAPEAAGQPGEPAPA
jgi:DNA-binding MarR family transcriptional regulator